MEHGGVRRMYAYRGNQATWTELAGLAALALSSLLGLVLMVVPPLVQPAARAGNAWPMLVCVGLWTVGAGWLFGLTLLNSHPTVWVADDGLVITAFLGYRIRIPWADVLAVRRPWGVEGGAVVLARRITPAHRLYGWLYARTARPAFVIGASLDRREELIQAIETQVRHYHGKTL